MTNKIKRIFHTWNKWECYRAGFFEDRPPTGLTSDAAKEKYREFLADLKAFDEGISKVFKDWHYSCEHNLTNDKMNRVAWIGQSAACAALGLPSTFKGGYNLLSEEQKKAADALALKRLNEWLYDHGYVVTDGKRNHKSSDMY